MLGGLQEAIVDPLVSDWKDAYWMQRAARERYPAANSALNFIPTPLGAATGVAANVDDLYHDLKDKDWVGAAKDVGGGMLDASRLKGYVDHGIRGLRQIAGVAPKMVGRGAVLLATPPAVYVSSVIDDQKKANQKYGDRPLLDISNELRSK